MKIFGLKIIKARKYDELCSTITRAGIMVRKYTKLDNYTNYGQSTKVCISDLSLVHCIENVVWSDVKNAILEYVNKPIETERN